MSRTFADAKTTSRARPKAVQPEVPAVTVVQRPADVQKSCRRFTTTTNALSAPTNIDHTDSSRLASNDFDAVARMKGRHGSGVHLVGCAQALPCAGGAGVRNSVECFPGPSMAQHNPTKHSRHLFASAGPAGQGFAANGMSFSSQLSKLPCAAVASSMRDLSRASLAGAACMWPLVADATAGSCPADALGAKMWPESSMWNGQVVLADGDDRSLALPASTDATEHHQHASGGLPHSLVDRERVLGVSMMVRNISFRYSKGDIVDILASKGLAGRYGELMVPKGSYAENRGYFFVSFFTQGDLHAAMASIEGKEFGPRANGKLSTVLFAHDQQKRSRKTRLER